MDGEAPLSPGHRQAELALAAALQDPRCVVALTGPAGAGKSFLSAAIAGRQGRVVWHLSALHDDLGRTLRLLRETRAGGVLIVDDAHALSVAALAALFAQLGRDRAALPRLILVARPTFWRRFDDPALAGARDRIAVTAVLFPLSAAESMQLLERRCGDVAATGWARSLVQQAAGNPGLLLAPLSDRPAPPDPDGRPRWVSAPVMSTIIAVVALLLAVVTLVISVEG